MEKCHWKLNCECPPYIFLHLFVQLGIKIASGYQKPFAQAVTDLIIVFRWYSGSSSWWDVGLLRKLHNPKWYISLTSCQLLKMAETGQTINIFLWNLHIIYHTSYHYRPDRLEFVQCYFSVWYWTYSISKLKRI